MAVTHLSFTQKLRRLWQPRRAAFWLMLVFNGLSSALGWLLHLAQPAGAWLITLTLLALGNAVMGWWMLLILWREGAGAAPPISFKEDS